MKILAKSINKDGSGSIKLMPQETEDMWHIYNLLAVGDHVTAVSFRKVQRESSTGSSNVSKVKIKLTIAVETVHFDPVTCTCRIKGKNVTEHENVKMGSYHTLELDLTRAFTIEKQLWDAMYLERVQVNVPKKRAGQVTGHDKAITKFHEGILEAIRRHVNFKDQFYSFMMAEAQKREYKDILENKSKFLLVHAPSGHKHALKEVLADAAVATRVENTKAFGEVRALDAFFDMLNTDPDRAFYGFGHVKKANDQKAVDALLVTDALFRATDFKTRKSYVDLVESVRANGGSVHIFSTLHVSGEQLNKLSGVAAILRFPLPEIEEEERREKQTKKPESKDEYKDAKGKYLDNYSDYSDSDDDEHKVQMDFDDASMALSGLSIGSGAGGSGSASFAAKIRSSASFPSSLALQRTSSAASTSSISSHSSHASLATGSQTHTPSDSPAHSHAHSHKPLSFTPQRTKESKHDHADDEGEGSEHEHSDTEDGESQSIKRMERGFLDGHTHTSAEREMDDTAMSLADLGIEAASISEGKRDDEKKQKPKGKSKEDKGKNKGAQGKGKQDSAHEQSNGGHAAAEERKKRTEEPAVKKSPQPRAWASAASPAPAASAQTVASASPSAHAPTQPHAPAAAPSQPQTQAPAHAPVGWAGVAAIGKGADLSLAEDSFPALGGPGAGGAAPSKQSRQKPKQSAQPSAAAIRRSMTSPDGVWSATR